MNKPATLVGNTTARYSLMIDGREIASFQELQGISSPISDTPPFIATLDAVVLKKLPGKPKPATLVLKRGRSSDASLSAWHQAGTANQSVARKSATIIVYDYEGTAFKRYKLENAWPSKIEIGSFSAGGSTQLMETVTIVSERIQRVSG